MKHHTTTRVFIFALLLLFGSVGVFGYGFYRLQTQGQQLQADLAVIKRQAYMNTEYTKLKASLTESEAERKRIENLVIRGDDGAVTFLSLADSLAQGLQVELSTKKLDEVEQKDAKFNQLVVEFGLVGESRSVLKLIQLFELLPYHNRVTGLTASRKIDPTTKTERMEATIVLTLSLLK